MTSFVVESRLPSYLSLTETQWEEKIEKSRRLMSPCVLCARRCMAERRAPDDVPDDGVFRSGKGNRDANRDALKSRKCAEGVCRTGEMARVASFGPHFGEEPPLVGRSGSGTIFFAGCNLKCIYCQNYDIAHLDRGWEITDEELSRIMLRLQQIGCHNVNLVSPTHVVPNILAAVRLAARKGLSIPLVYNTGGYDSLETLEVLDGVVDIYMPDMKYGEAEPAREFSIAPDYPEVNFRAVKEMHRQVGDLVTDRRGVAVRGLLVRHLVLPGGLAGTRKVMEFLAKQISKDTYVNIMDQYRPYYKAIGHPVLGRRIRPYELDEALKIAREAGLTRVYAY